MQPVGELLPSIYRKLVREAVDEQALALALWPVVVGPKVAERTRAVRLFGSTLVVEAATPEWRRQLSAMTWEIVGKLNAAAGKEVIRDLQFQVARRPPARAASAAGQKADEADAIADPHLRRMYRLSRRRRKQT
jgi:predicted nucleic acid-binding Zn ribbon protein